MTKKRYIRVLWVEDDPMITAEYPDEAFMLSEIELHPFPCWELAEKELDANYDSWDAIILDAKCKYEANDADKADKFLSHVFPRLGELKNRKNRTIPWYVLSGQGEDDIRDLIPDTNEWDKEWLKHKNRRFYSKTGEIRIGNEIKLERHFLFERIKDQVETHKLDLQIEYDYYPDVFHALDKLDLQGEVGFYLMHLLVPIHFSITTNNDYNNRYQELRKALENMFRHMVDYGILPPLIIGKDEKEGINLSWSSVFLGAGQPDKPELLPDNDSSKRFWRKIRRNTSAPIVPRQISHWLKTAVFQTGGAVHTSKVDAERKLNLDNYLPNENGSPYMLQSLTLGLCDFILWYEKFLQKNPDKELNARKFWALRNQKI